MTYENISPVFDAIVNRLNNTGRMSFPLKEHGLDRVYETIESVSEMYSEFDELGSSDVSILVSRVENSLMKSYKSLGLSF